MSATQPLMQSARRASVSSCTRRVLFALIAWLGGLLLLSPAAQAQGNVPISAIATDQSSFNLSNKFGAPVGASLNERGDYAFIGSGGFALFLRRAGSSTAERLLQIRDPVPGFSGSRLTSVDLLATSLNSAGHVAFTVSFGLSDGFVHSAILIYDGANYRTVVFSDDVAPGSGGQNYGTVSIFGFNENDEVAFTAEVLPLGPTTTSLAPTIYIAPDGGSPVRIAGPGDPAPETGGTFLNIFGIEELSFNNAAQVLFEGLVVGLGGFQDGLFLGSTAGVQKVVLEDDPVPAPGAGNFSSVFTGLLSDTGAVIFFDFESNIIWNYSGGNLAAIAQSGVTAAPAVIGGTLSFAGDPTLFATNSAGDLLFTSSITGSVVMTDLALLRRHSDGTMDVVAYAGQAAPGASGETFSGFFGASMAPDGRASFIASLSGGRTSINQQTGMANPVLLALDGQSAPLASGTFNLLNTPTTITLPDGSTYFESTVAGGAAYYGEFRGTPGNLQALMSTADTLPAGARIDLGEPRARNPFVSFSARRSGGRVSLFVKDNFSGTTTKLVSQGDPVPEVGGVFRTITAIPFVNANGQAIFLGTTDTGRTGIFMASPFTGLSKLVATGESSPVSGATYVTLSLSNVAVPSPLNDSGQVAFLGTLSNGQRGIFVHFPGAGVTTIAATGDAAPGGGTFTSFSQPVVINGFSQVAFEARSSVQGRDGFFIGAAGAAPQSIISEGDSLAGGTVIFLRAIISFTDTGSMAFVASMSGGVTGMFVGRAGLPVQTVVKDGDVAPGTGGTFSTLLASEIVLNGVALSSSTDLYLNDAGDVLFRSRIVGGSADSGLFRQLSGGALLPIALEGQALPGGLGTLSTISSSTRAGVIYTLEPDGAVALVNAFSNGSGARRQGIFAIRRDGTLAKIIAPGDSVPGSGGVLSSMGETLISDGSGSIVFLATATGGTANETIQMAAIGGGGGATSTTLVSSLNSSPLGQMVTFTATVAGAGETPTGGVSFRDNGFLMGETSLNAGGQATFSTFSLSAGSHTITAAYSGDGDFAVSTSSGLTQVVTVPTTKPAFVALGSSPNPAAVGQSVLVTAAVSSSAGGVPTGSVSFLDNGTSIGTAALNGSGVASFSTSSLGAGTHPITAQYFGDGNFTASLSAVLIQVVGASAPQVTVQITPIPQNVAAGTSVQFQATVENAGSNTDVTWELSGPGGLDSTGNYTAPEAISPATVTITATSISDPVKKASVQFTIAADALTTTQGPATIPAGSQLVVAIQLAGVPGDSTVPFALSCSNLPLGATCQFDPDVVTGQNPDFTFTIITADASSGQLLPLRMERAGPWAVLLALALLAMALVAGSGSAALGKRSYACGVLVLLCFSAVFLSSCSGISPSSVAVPAVTRITPTGKYQVLVTATPQSTTGGFVQTQLIVPFTVN